MERMAQNGNIEMSQAFFMEVWNGYERSKELEEENKKLKEFKTKREESRFYFKAQMERAEPKTASEAEDLQRAKELFEKLYREELSCLEEENKKLKEEIRFLEECLDRKEKVNKSLREKLKWWKDLVHKAKEFEYDEDGMDYIWQNTKNL